MNSNDTLQKITRKDGIKLATRLQKGRTDLPTLVFLGGYRSDMTGSKASFLAEFCAARDLSLLRFDYRGHGASEGEFSDGCIGDWLDDALFVIDQLTSGPLILVGSSMGGWIGLLIARMIPERIKGLIGIAAAPDFTDWVWSQEMTEVQQNLCRQQGYIDSHDGGRFTLKLFEDGAKHLVMTEPLLLDMPVILLQGKQDDQVPYRLAQKLATHITPTPAELILIEDGDHRLARDQDLALLGDCVLRMLEKL